MPWCSISARDQRSGSGRQVFGLVVIARGLAFSNAFMNVRIRRNRTWFTLGQKEPKKGPAVGPFQMFGALWKVFQNFPRPSDRIVQFCRGIRRDIFERVVFGIFAKNQKLWQSLAEPHPMFCGFIHHPFQHDFRGTAFRFGIAAANVGMDAGKPDLLDVLTRRSFGFDKRV